MQTNILKNNKFWLLFSYFLLSLVFIIIPIIVIIINAFKPSIGNSVDSNFDWIGEFIWKKLLFSIGISLLSSFFVLALGFPFAYLLSIAKSKSWKIICVLMVSSPIWLSLLVKVIGIKLLFDGINGEMNSTFGNMYTVITLVYLNLPIFILTVYNVLETLPSNLLRASNDLGRNCFMTFFLVVIPYAKTGIMSGLFLTFVTAIAATGITSFANMSNDGQMIGDIILELGQGGLSSNIALSRISALCLVFALIILFIFLFFYYIPKKIKLYTRNKKIIGRNSNVLRKN